MSHLEHIQSKATQRQTFKIQKWARLEAAKTQFEEFRKKLIHQIMVMEVKEGADFFIQLHKKIEFYKNHEVMDRIAKSVISGQALQEIHVKNVDENVHQGRALTQTHEPTQDAPQEQTIEGQIERLGVFTHESQAPYPEDARQQTETSVIESKSQETSSLIQESTEVQEASSESPKNVEKTTEVQKAIQPDELQSNETTSVNLENHEPTEIAEQKTGDFPTQSSLISTPQQSQAQETLNQSPSVEEKPTKEETAQETPVVKAQTTQIAQQKEESSLKSEEVKPLEEKSENPRQNSQEDQQNEAKVEATQQATEIPEQSKQPTPKEQTSAQEKKVEQKVEEKKEEVKEEKPEVKEEKVIEKEQKEEEAQNNQDKGGAQGKKNKKTSKKNKR